MSDLGEMPISVIWVTGNRKNVETSCYNMVQYDMLLHCIDNGRPYIKLPLRWCHNGHDGVSNHQPHHCLLNRLFRCRSKKTSKLRVTGLCAGNSPWTGEFPAQMASNAENVSIGWRHHVPLVKGTQYINLTLSYCLFILSTHTLKNIYYML